MKDNQTPQKWADKIDQLSNAAGHKLLDTQQSTTQKIELVPDKSISPGMFRPSKLALRVVYLAHPVTIRAVRKEIFMVGNNEFEDLEEIIQCQSCKRELDIQFWKFCPFCEASF